MDVNSASMWTGGESNPELPSAKKAVQQPADVWFDDGDADDAHEPENIAPTAPREQYFEPEVRMLSAIEQRMKQRRGGP